MHSCFISRTNPRRLSSSQATGPTPRRMATRSSSTSPSSARAIAPPRACPRRALPHLCSGISIQALRRCAGARPAAWSCSPTSPTRAAAGSRSATSSGPSARCSGVRAALGTPARVNAAGLRTSSRGMAFLRLSCPERGWTVRSLPAGLELALPHMKKGERSLLRISPAFAFGAGSRPPSLPRHARARPQRAPLRVRPDDGGASARASLRRPPLRPGAQPHCAPRPVPEGVPHLRGPRRELLQREGAFSFSFCFSACVTTYVSITTSLLLAD